MKLSTEDKTNIWIYWRYTMSANASYSDVAAFFKVSKSSVKNITDEGIEQEKADYEIVKYEINEALTRGSGR